MSITDVLRKFMAANGYRCKDISRLSGIPYSTILGLFEKGDDNAELKTLRRLRQMMRCSLDELVDDNIPAALPCPIACEVEERRIMEKFRKLDERGKNAVRCLLDCELKAIAAAEKQAGANKKAAPQGG